MEHQRSLVILTSHSEPNYALLSALRRSYPIGAIVFESQTKVRAKIFSKRVRKMNLRLLLDQLLFKALDVVWFQRQARAKAPSILGEQLTFRTDDFADAAVLETLSINSEAVLSLVQDCSPSLVIVSGTSVIGPRLLDILREVPVINIHCGITPRYRGAHGAFWAIVNGDWQNIGSTVHFVDGDIDSGGIISQGRIDPEPGDSPRDLALRQFVVGIGLACEAVRRIVAGDLSTIRRDDLDSRLYSSPTLTAYLKYRWRLKEYFSQSVRTIDG